MISTDDIIEEVAVGQQTSYDKVFQGTIKAANASATLLTQRAVERSDSIIVDQTNLTPKSRRRKLKLVPNLYVKVCIVCSTDEVTRHQRMASRAGKTIPTRIDYAMMDSFVYPTTVEGFDVVLTDEQYYDFMRFGISSQEINLWRELWTL